MHSTGTAEQMHMVEAVVLTIKAETCTDVDGSVFISTTIQNSLLYKLSLWRRTSVIDRHVHLNTGIF